MFSLHFDSCTLQCGAAGGRNLPILQLSYIFGSNRPILRSRFQSSNVSSAPRRLTSTPSS